MQGVRHASRITQVSKQAGRSVDENVLAKERNEKGQKEITSLAGKRQARKQKRRHAARHASRITQDTKQDGRPIDENVLVKRRDG